MKDQLFLLRPGFFAADKGPLYCGDSVPVEGLLSFCPELRDLIDVHYLAFPRPRAPLNSLLGDENQGIPVLILAPGREIKESALQPKTANGHRYFSDEKLIREYLSSNYGMPSAG